MNEIIFEVAQEPDGGYTAEAIATRRENEHSLPVPQNLPTGSL